jgi:hypothetical protein
MGKAPIETKKRMLGHLLGRGGAPLADLMPGKPFFSARASRRRDGAGARLPAWRKRTFWAALSLGNLAGAGDPEQGVAPFHPTKRRKPQTGQRPGPRVRLPTIYPDLTRPGIIVPRRNERGDPPLRRRFRSLDHTRADAARDPAHPASGQAACARPGHMPARTSTAWRMAARPIRSVAGAAR